MSQLHHAQLYRVAVGLGWLVMSGILSQVAHAQSQSFDVPVIINVVEPQAAGFAPTSISIAPASGSAQSQDGVALDSNSLVFNSLVCGGVSDLVQEDLQRFQELTFARAQATSPREQQRLDREIFEQALKLPDLITEDFGSRNIVAGESEDCDSLVDALTRLMEQVADYVAAVNRSRTEVPW